MDAHNLNSDSEAITQGQVTLAKLIVIVAVDMPLIMLMRC